MALEDILRSVVEFVDARMPDQRGLMKLANWSGVAFFWFASVIVTVSCVFLIIPAVWEHDEGSYNKPATWILLFFVTNMFLNYFRCYFTSPFYDVGKLNVPTAEGGKNWGYCVPCQQYIPPRAHHCTLCRRCVLKRESHCFFMGKCIGYANQRFFIVYCFYTALASFYALLSYGTFLHREIGPILSTHLPQYLLPYASFRWITGAFSTVGALSLLLFYITMMVGVGCTMLFFFQINLILQGQTSNEMAKKTNEYDGGAQMNLREVFGSYWWLCFLIPVKFELPVDGITWNRLKNIKSY